MLVKIKEADNLNNFIYNMYIG